MGQFEIQPDIIHKWIETYIGIFIKQRRRNGDVIKDSGDFLSVWCDGGKPTLEFSEGATAAGRWRDCRESELTDTLYSAQSMTLTGTT